MRTAAGGFVPGSCVAPVFVLAVMLMLHACSANDPIPLPGPGPADASGSSTPTFDAGAATDAP